VLCDCVRWGIKIKNTVCYKRTQWLAVLCKWRSAIPLGDCIYVFTEHTCGFNGYASMIDLHSCIDITVSSLLMWNYSFIIQLYHKHPSEVAIMSLVETQLAIWWENWKTIFPTRHCCTKANNRLQTNNLHSINCTHKCSFYSFLPPAIWTLILT